MIRYPNALGFIVKQCDYQIVSVSAESQVVKCNARTEFDFILVVFSRTVWPIVNGIQSVADIIDVGVISVAAV